MQVNENVAKGKDVIKDIIENKSISFPCKNMTICEVYAQTRWKMEPGLE